MIKNTNLLNPTIGKCFNLPKSNKRENKSPSLFDRLDMIAEEPVESKVEASAEHHGVQEDAQDQDLLRNSDQIIIHFIWNEKYLHTECLKRCSWRDWGRDWVRAAGPGPADWDQETWPAISHHAAPGHADRGKAAVTFQHKMQRRVEGTIRLWENMTSQWRCGSGFFWY